MFATWVLTIYITTKMSVSFHQINSESSCIQLKNDLISSHKFDGDDIKFICHKETENEKAHR